MYLQQHLRTELPLVLDMPGHRIRGYPSTSPSQHEQYVFLSFQRSPFQLLLLILFFQNLFRCAALRTHPSTRSSSPTTFPRHLRPVKTLRPIPPPRPQQQQPLHLHLRQDQCLPPMLYSLRLLLLRLLQTMGRTTHSLAVQPVVQEIPPLRWSCNRAR